MKSLKLAFIAPLMIASTVFARGKVELSKDQRGFAETTVFGKDATDISTRVSRLTEDLGKTGKIDVAAAKQFIIDFSAVIGRLSTNLGLSSDSVRALIEVHPEVINSLAMMEAVNSQAKKDGVARNATEAKASAELADSIAKSKGKELSDLLRKVDDVDAAYTVGSLIRNLTPRLSEISSEDATYRLFLGKVIALGVRLNHLGDNGKALLYSLASKIKNGENLKSAVDSVVTDVIGKGKSNFDVVAWLRLFIDCNGMPK